jgi:hypothetical protein
VDAHFLKSYIFVRDEVFLFTLGIVSACALKRLLPILCATPRCCLLPSMVNDSRMLHTLMVALASKSVMKKLADFSETIEALPTVV